MRWLLIAVSIVLGLLFVPPVHAGEHAVDGNSEITQELLDAAEAGDAEAQFQLGQADAQRGQLSYVNAANWYRLAAEEGHAGAQTGLGALYRDGLGIARNYEKALMWFRRAAEQDHADAQLALGTMYSGGRGVTIDFAAAMHWWRKAADQGQSTASWGLGLYYENGIGVPNDLTKALYWYRKAGEQGSSTARKKADQLERRLTETGSP